jgi:Mrp family chromosome partitioning ATPase
MLGILAKESSGFIWQRAVIRIRKMVTKEQILEALKRVSDPELGRDIVTLKMVEDVEIHGGTVSFTLNLTTPACPLRTKIEEGAREAVSSISGVAEVQMKTTANVMATRPYAETDVLSGVKNVIAVASGKGGVGKSTIAVNLALALSGSGAKVGILDADIYGPNIPLMMGVKEKPSMSAEMINPPSAFGVKVVSLGFFYKDETPLIWRGPMVAGAVRQLLTKVNWGELDYLVCDLPPGCLPAGTFVLMANNVPKPIEKVVVGEFVMSYDGQRLVPRRVLGVFPQGRQMTYRLGTPNRTIIASGNHPFLKYHRTNHWKRLDRLKVGDRLVVVGCVEGGQTMNLPTIEHSSNFIALPEKTTSDFMQIVGHFVGDGFIKRQRLTGIVGVRVCEPRDSKFREEYQSLYRKVFHCHIFDDNDGQKFAVASIPLAKLFASLDLDHKARDKRVPDWVFTLPLEQRQAFIRGYAEADASIRFRSSTKYLPDAHGLYRTVKIAQNTVTVESMNELLVRQMHELCLMSGFRASNVVEEENTNQRLPGGTILHSSVSYSFQFSLKVDKSAFKLGLVKEIEPLGDRETYDLQVDEYGNFVANSIIVHNTGDSSLTLTQTVPLGGVVIVTTPQEASVTIAQKALSMFRKLDVPILGVVENMSYFICTHCGEKSYIFSTGGGRRISSMLSVDFLGEIPLNASIREGMDKGMPVVVSSPNTPEANAFKELAFRVAGMVSIVAYSKSPK